MSACGQRWPVRFFVLLRPRTAPALASPDGDSAASRLADTSLQRHHPKRWLPSAAVSARCCTRELARYGEKHPVFTFPKGQRTSPTCAASSRQPRFQLIAASAASSRQLASRRRLQPQAFNLIARGLRWSVRFVVLLGPRTAAAFTSPDGDSAASRLADTSLWRYEEKHPCFSRSQKDKEPSRPAPHRRGNQNVSSSRQLTSRRSLPHRCACGSELTNAPLPRRGH